MKKRWFIALVLTIFFVVILWVANKEGFPQKSESSNIGNTGVNCGPKALSAIISYYRIQITWDSLAKISHTGPEGTTMYDLANTAKMLGFETAGIKTGYPGLSKLPLPSLVFVNNNHFATLLWVGTDSVLIEDEGKKNFVKRQEFLKMWEGKVLALYPGKELQNKLNNNINH